MLKIKLLLTLSISTLLVQAKKDSLATSDSLNLAQHFSKGHVSGHFRNFFMNTINEGDLRDYWTNAVGMSLHYESLPFKGFMFEMKGIFTFQTFSSNLTSKDAYTNSSSKWEKELYDVLDENNKTDLDRLEELFLHYQWNNSYLRYGRIPIDKTPLINQRDGRMKPYAFEGGMAHLNINKKLKSNSFIIHGVSPRSTVEWFQLNEAIGLNNNGFTPDGNKSDYHTHLNSNFLIAQELNYKTPLFSVSIWDFYLDKTFNLNWLQLEIENNNWKFGLIGVNQKGLNYQKSLPIESQYYTPNTSINIISSIIQKKFKTSSIAISRSDLFGNGRFLFPRELGRERLYTSITRSWAEGLGKAQITNLKYTYTPENLQQLELDVITNFIKTQGSSNYSYNKYGTRDYLQTIVEIDYNFKGKLKGLELDLLYIYRKDLHANAITYLEAFNKTNFHQINLILNVNF